MKLLEDKIVENGTVLDGNINILIVGSFLNQQIDTSLLKDMGREIARIYADEKITKVLTVEASGIALAAAAGMELNVPMVFAKKNSAQNVKGDVYKASVYSFTHKVENCIVVPKSYISRSDRVLIVDDFLANGQAFEGLIEIVNQASATVVGLTAAVEKGFQGGGDKLRKAGFRVESLAVIDEMSPEKIVFRNN